MFSLTPTHSEVYSKQYYVILKDWMFSQDTTAVSSTNKTDCPRQTSSDFMTLDPNIESAKVDWLTWYCWNIIESGIQPLQFLCQKFFFISNNFVLILF